MYLVRTVDGTTVAVHGSTTTGRDVIQAAAAKRAISNVQGLGLEFAGRQLDLSLPVPAPEGSTLRMTCCMLGGKPAEVHFITPINGQDSVIVDLEDDTPMYELKLRLQELTGVPVQHQKVMLQGVGNIVMGDKRSNIGFTHSASTGSFYLGLLGTDKK